MSTSCCDGTGETLVFTCVGAAYTGQLANRAGLDLMKAGTANLFCVAALAANRPDKLERARCATRRIAIDGCDDHCCRRIMEQAGVPVDVHLVVTDLGIQKQPQQPHFLVHAKRVVTETQSKLQALQGKSNSPEEETSCCG
jgi:uncharacterized metal-binding protein